MNQRNKDLRIAILMLAGALVLYVLPPISPLLTNSAKIALLLGGALLLVRVHRVISKVLYPSKGGKASQSETEIRLLIQSMGIIARADGKIGRAEQNAISEIHAEVFGIDRQHKEVSKILSELGSPIEVLGALGQNKSLMSPLMKQKIVQACHLVASSDLKIGDKERAQIETIGLALGLSKIELKEAANLAKKTYR